MNSLNSTAHIQRFVYIHYISCICAYCYDFYESCLPQLSYQQGSQHYLKISWKIRNNTSELEKHQLTTSGALRVGVKVIE